MNAPTPVETLTAAAERAARAKVFADPEVDGIDITDEVVALLRSEARWVAADSTHNAPAALALARAILGEDGNA